MGTRERFRYLAIGAVIVGIVAFVIIVSVQGIQKGQSVELATKVASQLAIGMSRAQVDAITDPYIHRRYRCSSRDLLLFGHTNPDRAGMIYLGYEWIEEDQLLDRIAGADSSMLKPFLMCTIEEP